MGQLSGSDERAVKYLPLLEITKAGVVAVVDVGFELEREACDRAEWLARSGLGRYRGAVAVVSESSLLSGKTRTPC